MLTREPVAKPKACDEVGHVGFQTLEVFGEGEQDEDVLLGVVPAPGLPVRQ